VAFDLHGVGLSIDRGSFFMRPNQIPRTTRASGNVFVNSRKRQA
jgi:hypothetical protein